MLKKSERVHTSAFKKRPTSRVRFRYGSVSVISPSPAAAAVVVSKKVCAQAVDRARLRRRIYAIVRPLIRSKRLVKTVIIYPTKEALRADFEDLKKNLSDTLI